MLRNFPGAFPVPLRRLSPRGSQDQSRPRSSFAMLRSRLAKATSIPDPVVSQNLLSAYRPSQVPRRAQCYRVTPTEVVSLRTPIRFPITCKTAWRRLHPRGYPHCVEPSSNCSGAGTLLLAWSASYPWFFAPQSARLVAVWGVGRFVTASEERNVYHPGGPVNPLV